ncbi:GlmU family protein [Sphingobacterium kyonggiense]|uniref:GlmU family protein n=1 Tax=Sphingobacterium kyonggiense TaxID=714075 RepID=A0ABP7YN77_9SPHI
MSLTVILYDKAQWRMQLLPLTATRPVGNLRVGICTLQEKWQYCLNASVSYLTTDYLQPFFHQEFAASKDYLVIRANILPSDALLEELAKLQVGEVLVDQESWIAMKLDYYPDDVSELLHQLKPIACSIQVDAIQFPEDIFLKNKEQLLFDFRWITKGRSSASLSEQNMVFGDWLFIEEGAQVEGVSLNSLEGPIYIGKHAKLEEGSFLRGYVGIGEGTRVKMGAKLYPNLSIGPGSTVGGELNNTVIWGNSAKGHDGYLGCSVIGEGCNLGAGTSNSNLKNNWQSVGLFDYEGLKTRDTGLLKCGLIMGDHAMLGINSAVNTGSVIGVAAQVAISNIIPKFVPDFSWLVGGDMQTYKFDKFAEMINRRQQITGADYSDNMTIFEQIYNQTTRLRDEVINNKTKSNYA